MFTSAQEYWLICALAAQWYHVSHEPWKIPWNHRSSWISLQGIPSILKTKKSQTIIWGQMELVVWSIVYGVCRLDLFFKGKQASKQAEVSSVSSRLRIWQQKYGIKWRAPAGYGRKEREKQRNNRASMELISPRVSGVGLRWSGEWRQVRSA